MKSFKDFLIEDGGGGGGGGGVGGGAPTNSVGGGGIAGIGFPEKSRFGEPGVDLRKKRRDEALQSTWGAAAKLREDSKGNLKNVSIVGKQIAEAYDDPSTFRGAKVFEVDMDSFMKSRHGKNRYHRYSRYVGEDDNGEAIRQHGRAGHDVIVKEPTTAVMTYLRRKPVKA